MKRASYREAIAWIAEMDESAERDTEVMEGVATVILVADLFGVTTARVAHDVVRRREKDES